MPRMMVWFVSGSVWTLNVGSSCMSFASATPIFSWSTFVFGSMATAMTGSGNVIVSRTIGLFAVADRVAGGDVAQADGRADVARPHFLDLFALVRVHLQQASDALGVALGRVEHGGAGLDVARVDAEERELADERVGHDLEDERRRTARRPTPRAR